MGSWQNSNFDSLHSSATGTSGALESGLAADMRIAFCHPDLGLGGKAFVKWAHHRSCSSVDTTRSRSALLVGDNR